MFQKNYNPRLTENLEVRPPVVYWNFVSGATDGGAPSVGAWMRHLAERNYNVLLGEKAQALYQVRRELLRILL